MRGHLFAFILLTLALVGLSSASATEMRGLWVVRTGLTSPAAVDAVVDQASEAGINTLFVQIRGRGDAFYLSDAVPRSPLLSEQPPDFDPLARLLARASTRGIAVHAWLNVLLSAHFNQPLPTGHELARHPEWMMVPRSVADAMRNSPSTLLPQIVRRGAQQDGDAEGFYVSPVAAGVPEHFEAVVRELLARYAVAGVHLDFIRYPSPDYDFSVAALKRFSALCGTSGSPLRDVSLKTREWQGFLRDSLTQLTAGLARAAHETRPAIVVSAAVVPDRATAYSQKYQDWPQWLALGILDAVCPMAYATEDRIFKRQIEDAREALRSDQLLWAGIGAYRLSPEGVVTKVRLARSAGAHGIILFSHECLRADLRQRLRQEAFATEMACESTTPCPMAP